MDNSRVAARSPVAESPLIMGIRTTQKNLPFASLPPMCKRMCVCLFYSFIFHRFISACFRAVRFLSSVCGCAMKTAGKTEKKKENKEKITKKDETTCSRLLGLNIFSASQFVSHTHTHADRRTDTYGSLGGTGISSSLAEAHTASKSL